MANSFLYNNKLISVQASLTAGSESASYPKENVYDFNAAKPWRTANASSAYTLSNDFGAATTIDTLGLANVNFTSSCTLKVQASDLSDFSVLNLDDTINVSGLGLDPAYSNIYHKCSSSQTRRYWRISINDTTNPEGYYEVGEMFLGQRVTLGTGQDFQTAFQSVFSDPNIVHQTEFLQDWAYIIDVDDVRNITIEFSEINSTTRDSLRKLKRYVKSSGYPFFFCPNDTTAPAEAFFVRLNGDFELVQANPRTYTIRLNMRELARGQTLPASN